MKRHEQKSNALEYELLEPLKSDKEVDFIVAFLQFLCILLVMSAVVAFLFDYFSRINNI